MTDWTPSLEEQILKVLIEIRDELRAGRDANARRVLGDPYRIDGEPRVFERVLSNIP